MRASSITISVWTQTSPSGCHSGSCGQPTSASSSGNSRSTTPSSSASAKPIDGRSRLQQQLLDLAPDPLRRADRRAECRGRARRGPASTSSSKRAANCSARSTRRLSSPKVPRSTTRSRRALEIGAAVERDRGSRPSADRSAIALIVKSRRRAASSSEQRRIARRRRSRCARARSSTRAAAARRRRRRPCRP